MAALAAQLIATLRFLKLIQGDVPQEDMHSLVNSSYDDRRFIIAFLVKDSYKMIPFDNLERATPSMVKEWFGAYPIDGHTMRKAISFFVNACKEAELPMSNAVRKMAKNKRARNTQKSPNQPTQSVQSIQINESTNIPPQGKNPSPYLNHDNETINQTYIYLKSGGTVNIGLDVDLFQLSNSDREFVLSIIDLAKTYRKEILPEVDIPINDNRDPRNSPAHKV